MGHARLAAAATFFFGLTFSQGAPAVADGFFDTTWRGFGHFVFDGDPANSEYSDVRHIVVEPDGNLLLGGGSFHAQNNQNYWWLGDISGDGQFVPTFGANDTTGRITDCQLGFTCPVTEDKLTALLVQPDQEYLILTTNGPTVARLGVEAHARVRTQSGPFLIASNDSGSKVDPATMALQADGNVLLAGSGYFSSSNTVQRFGVTRLNGGDFSLDQAFGAHTDLGITFAGGTTVRVDGADSSEQATHILVQPDGRIVLVGWGSAAGSDTLEMARLLSNGLVDTSFNGTGTTKLPWSGGSISFLATAARLDRAGRIVAATASSSGSGLLVARVNAGGTPDTSLGADGFVFHAISGCVSVSASGVAVDSAGRILVGGYCYTGSKGYFLVVRLRGDSGALDSAFGYGGVSLGWYDDGTNTYNPGDAFSLDEGGRPLIGGSSGSLPGSPVQAGMARLAYDLIQTDDFESVPRGCLVPDCN